ncbi:MAG TPA: AAA family ATPase [Tepidisphaeraceae bacterium]|jgi:hypothetical protein
MSEQRHAGVTTFPGTALLLPFAERVADIPPERVEWLSMSRLAVGKITVLDGDPGLGKSTVTLDWAAKLTRGENLPYGPANRPRGVLILSAEDGKADTIRPRLEAAGADLRRVFLFEMRDEQGNSYLPSLPHHLEALGSQIEATDAVLVIIDPLVAYLSGELKAINDQDVRRMLSPLATMLTRARAAGLALRHLNKATGMASLYRGGGSIGIIGAARFGLLIARDPEDETGKRRILAVQKANIGEDDAPSLVYRLAPVPGTDVARVVWEGESALRAHALTAGPVDESERSIVDEARAWLIEVLGGGSLSAKELRRQATEDGIAWRTVERAKTQAGIFTGRVGFGRGGHWVWSLAPIAPDDFAIDRHIDRHEEDTKKPVVTPFSP